MIDTHAHLNLPPLVDAVQSVLTRAQQAGVSHAVVIGTNGKTSEQAVALAKKHDSLRAAVGIHPEEVLSWQDEDVPQLIDAQLNTLEQLATESSVAAIGECGLDYVSLQNMDIGQARVVREHQIALCGKQIKLAKRLGKPVSLHCRNTRNATHLPTHSFSAYDDLLSLIAQVRQIPIVLHCISGSPAYVRQALSYGAYISVAGNVTYQNAPEISALLDEIPLERLMIETDCPFLSPIPVRGTPNEPAHLVHTAAYIASHYAISLSTLDEITTQTARLVFWNKATKHTNGTTHGLSYPTA